MTATFLTKILDNNLHWKLKCDFEQNLGLKGDHLQPLVVGSRH